MQKTQLDDFEDLSAWLPVASGLAQLEIGGETGPRGRAMRIDYDFKGGGGFVVARKTFSIRLPETYAFVFDVRGAAPRNKFEFKLADPTGKNVWWFHRDAFEVPGEWQTVEIPSSAIEFAWGPAGAGRMSEVAAIEIAIAAGPGGKGTLSIADLRLEDRTVYETPMVRASSEAEGHPAASILDGSTETSWRSQAGGASHWVLVDFGAQREYGGLIITWEPGGRARRFEVLISDDASTWRTVHASVQADAAMSYVFLPDTRSRYLRLNLLESVVDGPFGIAALQVQGFEFSRSIDAFFRHVAQAEGRGAYPKYLYGEQTYSSPVGVSDGNTCALLNEEGMVEVDKGTFSIEPFVFDGNRLVSWADVAASQELEKGYLPVPSSVWTTHGIELRTTAFARRTGGAPVLYVRYRLSNTGPDSGAWKLFAAVRPFQVTPPWQAFEGLGGVSRITHIVYEDGVARVNGERSVVSITRPCEFGAAAFEQGAIAEHLRAGRVPGSAGVADAFGFASGAFGYPLTIPPGAHRDVWLAIPFGVEREPNRDILGALASSHADEALADVVQAWERKLNALELRVPAAARGHVETLRTAAAHILVNRDGPALQPGPRRYTRAWIRDGAIMAAALLRMACVEEAKQFTRWYAGFQAADGNVPCAVDRKGADWLVEHDSHGELIFAVAECYRFTGDTGFLSELWPAVVKAVDYIEGLRATRTGREYEAADKRARFGLLPESASHEGYLAHPVHAYWDDFWALRGLRDVELLARARGDEGQKRRAKALAEALQQSLYESIERTIAERGIDYVPGSVEWADFDPTATANAISLLDELRNLPRGTLERTFAEYLAGFRRRCRNEIDWANYTPYEVRIAGALIHLGWRAEANELLDFLLSDRRPIRWNQWPEIAWRDPKSPGHIGDVPHAWIGAEYILAFRAAFAFERANASELVIGAGIPPAWLEGEGVQVRALPTYYGALDYSMNRRGNEIALQLSLSGSVAAEQPRIVVAPPLAAPLAHVEVDGKRVDTFTALDCTLAAWPCEVRMRCGEPRTAV